MSSLKPQFFVWRPNGQQVPVIPIDELPTNIIIHGVPRVLAAKDTAGMTSIGEFECRHCHYDVEFVGSKTGILNYQPDRAVNTSPPKSNASARELTGLTMDEGYPAPRKSYGIQERVVSIETSALGQTKDLSHPITSRHNDEAESDAATIDSIQVQKRAKGTKEYCSYWLRRGECDYAQQGCLYKHEMPKDADALERVGLRDFPQWYRERFQVSSLLAVPGSGAAGGPANISKGKLDKNWRSAPRSVPNSYASVVAEEFGKSSTNGSSACATTLAPATSRTSTRAPRVLRSGSNSSTPSGKASTSSNRRGQAKFLSRAHYASMSAVSTLQHSDSDEPKDKALDPPSTSGGPHTASKPKFMTVDELVARNALRQIEEEEAKDAERKAKLAACSVPFNQGAASPTGNSRPCSRASDESVVSNPGMITPTSTSYDSDVVGGKCKPVPAAKITAPATRTAIARYQTEKTEQREQAVHEARRKLEAGIKRRTGSQQSSSTGNLSVESKKQEVAIARATERERQIEQELLNFGFEKENEGMGAWRADRWDHDD